MSPAPPIDRHMALACSLRVFHNRWLYARCRCGYGTVHPVRLLLQENPGLAVVTTAEVVLRLRCRGCQKSGRQTVSLGDQASDPAFLPPAVKPGWSLLLYEAPL